jgi:hypothetical protein
LNPSETDETLSFRTIGPLRHYRRGPNSFTMEE